MALSPRLDYATCKDCGGHREDVGLLSWQRLCAKCATQRAADNNVQIATGVGPYAEHRLRQTLMAARRALVAIEREGT